METTANLSLPYLMPSQAQKHVTHNEALRMLDALVHLAVVSRMRTDPPANPANGERHIVATGATGAWSGWDGDIAFHGDSAWLRLTPQVGWRAWVANESLLIVWDGNAWTGVGGGSGTGVFESLGVLTSPDSTNRLAVKSDAVLLSHDDQTPGTGDLHVTVNKSAAGKDAAVVFQDARSSRALIGLLGDDNFHFKVSPDGSTFRTAMSIAKDNGRMKLNEPVFSHSTVNVLGKALTGAGDGYFCFTVANTNADNTNKGGAVMTGAPYGNANAPFMVLGPWATNSQHGIFYGGGGWGCPDATQHLFYAGPYQPTLNNTSTLAFTINNAAISASRNTVPATDNTYSLGTASLKWSVVYSNTGTINTSDERLKDDIAPVPVGLDFILDLKPVRYRWKNGGHDIVTEMRDPPEDRPDVDLVAVDVPVPRPGGRTHFGLVAQQVKATLDAHGIADFAGWTLSNKDDPASEQGLRYDQFVPILIKAVQELAAEVATIRRST